MYVNSNRPVKFLLISVSLIVVGCAETPQTPISYNPKPVVIPQVNKQQANVISGRERTAQSHKNTVWERLLSLYKLPEIDNDRVNRQLNWYLDHPSYIARIQQRAEPYLHLILDEVEANNIPGELALLPVVESAFIPDAYSKADASGLWQFIPDTGKLYGLEQSSWYDGRRDILDSTQAATAFLKDLGDSFNGDWLLALASYNWGKGNVWKSMDKNQSVGLATDYWSLDMPRETADYVPRLLAIAKLIANADDYGVPLNHIPNKRYLDVVPIDSPLDLQKAAQLANVPFDKFMKLNPGFSRASTAAEGPHRLLIPTDRVEQFKTNLAQLPVEERIDQTQLAVETEERAIREEERQERAEYQKEQKELKLAQAQIAHQTTTVATAGKYKVKSGETLTAIAARNHTTVQALLKANPNADREVRSGTVLKMPTVLAAQKTDAVQWNVKSAKNQTSHVQLAMADSKKSHLRAHELQASAKLDKQHKTPLLAALDKKVVNNGKSQNYRKAYIEVAELHKASLETKVNRAAKKVKART